ncbi:HAD family hydrolase [Pseudidiomarina mangrovi]|uniref:HAD family hydrolase n=1 Tax=Pseudidiomarina mangrovi TaxID=2487133 RepID=UPI000FCC93CF|nr:HAD-IA family hydrolase [Pseudidiomarina mangrovi]
MNYSLIIFDWDGTLMDSVGRIVSSMQYTARVVGLNVPSESAVRDIIGISLLPAIDRLFGRLNEVQMAQFMQVYRQQYVYDDATPTGLFDGAHELLSDLRSRGFRLAVATGKARHGLERVWDETNSRHYFDYSRCADESESKPSPKMLLELTEQAGVGVQQALMIGDSIHDMQMAQRAQMAAIGVSFGAHDSAQLKAAGAHAIISQLSELSSYVADDSSAVALKELL